MTSSAGWSAAAHLVRSTGFGASGDLVDAVAAAGPSAWLQASLRAAPESDPGAAAAPAPTFEALPPAGQDASTEQNRSSGASRSPTRSTELIAWWIRRMVAVQNPLVEKLTFGWHNHFATSATKVRSAAMLLGAERHPPRQGPRHASPTWPSRWSWTRPSCSGWTVSRTPSRRPTRTSRASSWSCSRSAARAGTPSRTCARARERSPDGPSTGRSGTVAFVARRHDAKPKTVLGTTANLDATGVRPASCSTSRPRRRSSRPGGGSSSPDPTRHRSDELEPAGRGIRLERDLTALFQAMLTDDAYAATAGSLVVSPVEWVVGAMRSLHVKTDDDTVKKAAGAMRALGQLPFFPPNVSGWPSGQAWLSTASATTRVQTAAMLARAGDLQARCRPHRRPRARRRRGAPARDPGLLEPHAGRADDAYHRPPAPRRHGAGLSREPGDLMATIPPLDPRKPMDGLTRRTLLRASGVAGATAAPGRRGRGDARARPGPRAVRPAAGEQPDPRAGHDVRRQRRAEHRCPVCGSGLPRCAARARVRRRRRCCTSTGSSDSTRD